MLKVHLTINEQELIEYIHKNSSLPYRVIEEVLEKELKYLSQKGIVRK
jgi:archaellum biogenesis ATPase FlaH